MFIRLNKDADVESVKAELQRLGLWTETLRGQAKHVEGLRVADHSTSVATSHILAINGVDDVLLSPSSHPRIDSQANQPVKVGPWTFGAGAPPVLMAGPCSVESEKQIHESAAAVASAGGHLLRGGAYKPRTSPYSFAGHGRPALPWLRAAADAHGLGVVTEVMSETNVETVAAYADILQIGSRNMQNFALLKAVGQTQHPVLLKRGMAATVDEWLMAGEHLMAAGAKNVIFCERGIQSFDTHTRNFLDLNAVALLKHVYKQPVVVDPSHAVGRRDLIVVMAKAALAAGADGLLVEVAIDAGQSLSDGPQALNATELAIL